MTLQHLSCPCFVPLDLLYERAADQICLGPDSPGVFT